MDNHHDPFESLIIVYVFILFFLNVSFYNIDGLLLEDIFFKNYNLVSCFVLNSHRLLIELWPFLPYKIYPCP